jgi:transposase-like protein
MIGTVINFVFGHNMLQVHVCRQKKTAREAQRDLPSIPKELIDQFVNGPMSAEAIQDASMAFKKALIERALGAELGHHLGYPQGADRPEESINQRNGKSGKTVLTDDGPLRLDIPRDRDGSFAPILIPKHERRFTGFDDKIIAMYARGMTFREVRAFLSEQYGTDVCGLRPLRGGQVLDEGLQRPQDTRCRRHFDRGN